MQLLWMLVTILALSGLLMAVTSAAYVLLDERRIHNLKIKRPLGRKLYNRAFANMFFSSAIVVTTTFLGRSWLFHDRPTSVLWIIGHGLLVLLVYDFFYYLLHRYAFHEWMLLRRVHAVHHAVRHPTAIDSLYLHPVETALGLALLFVSIALLGPVHLWTYGLTLLIHASLNILVHSGINLPFFPFRAISFLARKHDVHHTSMKGGNYASLSPLYDILFGTAE